ncbi:MocR-like pyridoxine biosynthesis transcription factor PdxR [Larkinella soli]|uniref:MocR-like pyridoxine biosynthesis transcription factor PdxR n=1 Tax=Larkinella soli TaxID=1770527 RepID=UPI000FFB6ACF|nr:PLP-dependent aminotransferase family protein [Larkinella soli]
MSKQAPKIDLPGPALERKADLPLHQQVYEHIRQAIVDGRLQPRLRLPATRMLAADWGISRNIVLLAFEQLLLEGYLVARTGSGTFVADQPARLSAPPPRRVPVKPAEPTPRSAFRQAAEAYVLPRNTEREAIRPFQTSLPSLRDFPFSIWNRLAVQVYRGLHIQHLGYGDAAGHGPLREAIARHVGVNRAVRCTPEQVVIVQGTQQALFLTASLLLEPGDAYWMEDPGYPAAHASFQAVGAVACPVPVGSQGLDLDYALTRYPRARLVYVTPSHQYPMGGAMPYPVRKRLLDWAQQRNAWILEDDYDSELRFSGRPLPSLQGLDPAGRVIYVGTFSKTLFPALRMAYLILPDAEMARLFARGKVLLDRQGPVVEQLILTKFMEEGHFGRHIRRMQQLYETRQNGLLDMLKAIPTPHGPLGSNAGMNLLVRLPESLDDRAVSAELAKEGIIAPPLSNYTLEHRQPPALLLGYAAFTKEQMQTAVTRLGEVLRRMM